MLVNSIIFNPDESVLIDTVLYIKASSVQEPEPDTRIEAYSALYPGDKIFADYFGLSLPLRRAASNDVPEHCNKTFKQMVSVRDFQVDQAIEKGVNLRVTCGEFPSESMILSPEEAVDLQLSKSQVFTSKTDDTKKYRLINYFWKPNV